ncbi:MAG: YihY/virulence factor BrkB family protein [Actinomycetota bacterium]
MQAITGAVKRYVAENMSDRAAALTYYSVLSLFPALLAVVALVGVFGTYPETTDKILQIVETVGPSSAVDTFRGTVESVVQNKGGSGALLGIGLLGALWSASGYVAAFMRASNEIYEVPRDRSLIRKLPVRLGLTIMMTILLAAVAISLVLTGPLAEAVGGVVGLESTAVTIWSIAKWPVLVLVTAVAFSLLYFAAPNARQPSMRAILPGGLVAVILWIAASVGFAIYVANFASYNKTYGTVGGLIVALLWLYISNTAILLGALFNAERQRSRQGLSEREPLDMDLRDPKGKEISRGRR